MGRVRESIARVVWPNRRWFQFSLKTLLFFVVVVSPPLAWLGVKLEAKRRERAAVKEVLRLRGRVIYLSKIHGRDAAPPHLRWLKPIFGDDLFDSVDGVFISLKRLDAGDLAFLADLRDVQSLALEWIPLTDDALVHLRGMRKLREHRGLNYFPILCTGSWHDDIVP